MPSQLTSLLMKAQRLPFVFRTTGVRLSAFFLFPINPQSYTLNIPTRGNIVQTFAGNFENFFGQGIAKGKLTGTFGFEPRPQIGLAGLPLPGQLQYKYLETLVSVYYNEIQKTVRDNDAQWQFFNLTDLQFFRIRLKEFSYQRSTQHQFLHHYDIQFEVIEDMLNIPRLIPEDTFLSQLSLDKITKQLFNGLGTIPDNAVGDAVIQQTKVLSKEIFVDEGRVPMEEVIIAETNL